MASKKIIHIRWVDSTSWGSWMNLPMEDTNLCIINTVGYLLEETKDRVVVAGSVSSANHGDGVIAIPKGAIIKRKTIK